MKKWGNNIASLRNQCSLWVRPECRSNLPLYQSSVAESLYRCTSSPQRRQWPRAPPYPPPRRTHPSFRPLPFLPSLLSSPSVPHTSRPSPHLPGGDCGLCHPSDILAVQVFCTIPSDSAIPVIAVMGELSTASSDRKPSNVLLLQHKEGYNCATFSSPNATLARVLIEDHPDIMTLLKVAATMDDLQNKIIECVVWLRYAYEVLADKFQGQACCNHVRHVGW